MNTPTKAMWRAPLVAAAGGKYDAEALAQGMPLIRHIAGDWRVAAVPAGRTRVVMWRERARYIERQVKHMPAWLNEWDVRLLAAKEWETR